MTRRYDSLTDLPYHCVHYWLCGNEDELVVHAICKKCDAKADFMQVRYAWSSGLLPRHLYDATFHWTKPVNEVDPHNTVEAEY